MPSRLSTDEQDQARMLYVRDRHLSVEDVANSFGVPRTTMLRYLKGLTRPKGGQVRTLVPTAAMQQMRDEGLSFREIGERVGLSTAGVQYRLRNYNGNGR